MDGAIGLFQDDFVAFYFVGALPGVFPGEAGEDVDGAVGVHVGGGMGRHYAFLLQGKAVLGIERQRGRGRFRPGIGNEHLRDTDPFRLGIIGLLIAQDAARRAHHDTREKEKNTFHGDRFLQR